MSKKIILLLIILAILAFAGYNFWLSASEQMAPAVEDNKPVNPVMTENDARAIAQATCVKGGEVLGPGTYNESTKTWWFDANLNASQPNCNPACVVSVETGTAEINWRCTGAIPPVEGREGGNAGAGGNLGSVPSAEDQTGGEALCSEESRKAEMCTMDYTPVCALVQIQCIKAPCDPIKQTYSNACEACKNSLVMSYTAGECEK